MPPPFRPSAYTPDQTTTHAKRGGLGGAQSTGCARHSAATCTERFGPRCRGDENGYHLGPTSSAPTSTSTSTGHPDSQFRCPDGHSAQKLGCGATNKGAVLLPMLVQPKAAPATAHDRLERTQARPPKPEPPSPTPPRRPRHPHHGRCPPRRRWREKHAPCADAAPLTGSGACSGSRRRKPCQHQGTTAGTHAA